MDLGVSTSPRGKAAAALYPKRIKYIYTTFLREERNDASVSTLARSVKAPSDCLTSTVTQRLADNILRDAAPTLASCQESSSSSSSLVTSMAQRLRVVEAKLRAQHTELEAKETELALLKDQLRGAAAPCGWCADHQADAARWRRQVDDMVAFLRDYGLVWVGGGDEERPSDKSPRPELVAPTEVDYDRLMACIERLNVSAGGGTMEVAHDTTTVNVHRLQPKAAMPLTLFRDGLMLCRGPFRPFEAPHTRAFVKDLLDGFFPFELKERHPDGVLFDVLDKRDQCHAAAAASAGRSGGQSINGQAKTRGLADIGNPLIHLTADAFLNKLPEATVSNGLVVPIRDEIAHHIHSLSSQKPDRRVVVVDSSSSSDRMSTTRRATLQIRTWHGAQTIVLDVPYMATLRFVKERVADESGLKMGSFSLSSAFPAKVLTDDAMTIEEAGLVPTATLHMQLL
ncbi:Aste57867_21451 [Aphanomyces stellatus]|uniref:UBX domain-containing protein 11 n=1 Tax=Aphanomyces stellatus TaxID=120398 RepID=A0A485LHH7_9STRA|nr:hypothetical protein As57867_021382 [Aphanomyces stellatus]VFT98122.1 Aste57867_21451 [Aphanomyces stellatus]